MPLQRYCMNVAKKDFSVTTFFAINISPILKICLPTELNKSSFSLLQGKKRSHNIYYGEYCIGFATAETQGRLVRILQEKSSCI